MFEDIIAPSKQRDGTLDHKIRKTVDKGNFVEPARPKKFKRNRTDETTELPDQNDKNKKLKKKHRVQ